MKTACAHIADAKKAARMEAYPGLALRGLQPTEVLEHGAGQDGMSSLAFFSTEKTKRYALHRQWSHEGGAAHFLMVNPSTACAHTDDATIRKCIGFAKRWGCGAIWVTNLYAYRATDVRALGRVEDAGAAHSDSLTICHIRHAAWLSRYTICAWGASSKMPKQTRDKTIEAARVALIDAHALTYCLGTTQDGSPKHPLYLKSDTPIVPFELSTTEGSS